MKTFRCFAPIAIGVSIMFHRSTTNQTHTYFDRKVKEQKITVFYNIYTADMDAVSMVKQIVQEQLGDLQPYHKVLVRSIGASFEIPNTTRIRHDETGDEIETLELLWKHCYEHPTSRVAYIHSKGSFHPNPANAKLRKFLTRGALSDSCSFLPEECNVCSSRMSPLPHPHTSGNMWLARCSYVKKLLNPIIFKLAMGNIEYPINVNKAQAWCLGRERYAAEHWIHSHPSVQPCDVAGDEINFFWGYSGVPDHKFLFNLSTAPRFPLQAYAKKTVAGCNLLTGEFNMSAYATVRRIEYEWMYGEDSLKKWWDNSNGK
mmetsp:Transcript_9150/g.25749  ORF Transcript_9150/g.25749 Transcript_9150/m.25749 type:complete len:316 (-) Transcript_9150:1729-2676(-)